MLSDEQVAMLPGTAEEYLNDLRVREEARRRDRERCKRAGKLLVRSRIATQECTRRWAQCSREKSDLGVRLKTGRSRLRRVLAMGKGWRDHAAWLDRHWTQWSKAWQAKSRWSSAWKAAAKELRFQLQMEQKSHDITRGDANGVRIKRNALRRELDGEVELSDKLKAERDDYKMRWEAQLEARNEVIVQNLELTTERDELRTRHQYAADELANEVVCSDKLRRQLHDSEIACDENRKWREVYGIGMARAEVERDKLRGQLAEARQRLRLQIECTGGICYWCDEITHLDGCPVAAVLKGE